MEKPSKEELFDAEDICYDLAKYIEGKWPSATNEISTLRETANILYAHAVDNLDDDLEDDENGKSPTTKN